MGLLVARSSLLGGEEPIDEKENEREGNYGNFREETEEEAQETY